jgi:opacity protein-like surface antigen
MRLLVTSSIFAMLMAATSSPALAQTPRTDSAAVGADVGVFLPRADSLKSGIEVDGFYEYYLSPRTSVRLGGGWMNPKLEREDDDSIRYFRVGGDLVYNWEGGSIHPFAGVGLGVYFLQETDNGDSFGDQDTKFGGALFGGAEFFTSNTLAVKAEAKYHVVTNADGFNLDGLSLTIGLKKYF